MQNRLRSSHLLTLESLLNKIVAQNWEELRNEQTPPTFIFMFDLSDDFEFGIGIIRQPDKEEEIIQ